MAPVVISALGCADLIFIDPL